MSDEKNVLKEAQKVVDEVKDSGTQSLEDLEKDKAPIPDYVEKINKQVQQQINENDDLKHEQLKDAQTTDASDNQNNLGEQLKKSDST